MILGMKEEGGRRGRGGSRSFRRGGGGGGGANSNAWPHGHGKGEGVRESMGAFAMCA